MSLFEQIISLNNLWNAWIKAQAYSSSYAPYYERTAYQKIERYIDEVAVALQNQLRSNTFVPSPCRIVRIPKGDASRLLYFQSPIDSVVTQAIVNIVGSLFEAEFSSSSFGHRLAVGKSESREVFEPWQQTYNAYISRARAFVSRSFSAWYHITDVKDFYPSINLDRLLGQIALEVEDPRALGLIELILKGTYVDENNIEHPIPGLPPGTIHGHFFANVYLNKLDKLMSETTDDYVRYVDDVCFVCNTEDALENAKSTFRSELANINLSPNLTKSETHPILVPNPLFEHTRKLKYDLRFGAIQDLKVQGKQASRQFNDLFLRVEQQEDIERIAHESGAFVVNFLKENEEDAEALEKVALTLLETGITRTSTLRAVLAAAMQCNLDNPSFGFLRFLENTTDLEKLTFLQLLPFSGMTKETIATTIIALLLETWLESENYLVRAGVFDALHGIQYELQIEDIINFHSNEETNYVSTRILQCLEFASAAPKWSLFPGLLTDTDAKNKSDLLYVLERLFRLGEFSRDEFNALAPVLFSNISDNDEDLIRLLSLATFYGTSNDIEQAYLNLRVEIRDAIGDIVFQKIAAALIQASNFTALQQLAEALEDLDLLRSGSEVSEQIAHTDAQNLDERFREQLERYGAPRAPCPPYEEIINCIRDAYGELSDYAGYVCKYYECNDGTRGTIEIIDSDRLLSSTDFNSIDDWWNYIEALEQDGIIDLYSKGVCPNDDEKIYSIYRISEGFLTLQEWISNRVTPSNEEDITQLIKLIVDVLKKTQEDDFLFQGINPWTVLYGQGKCKLLNVGYSLRNPKYYCKSRECQHHTTTTAEVGPTTSTHYLGLMLSEALLLDCPVSAVNIHKRKWKRNYLQEMFHETELSPHFLSILGRLLATPPHRYSFLGPLRDDIEHLTRFQYSFHDLQSRLDDEGKDRFLEKYKLFDFMQFRFQVANRNPSHKDAPPLGRTKQLISSLSNDIKYLSNSIPNYWNTARLPFEIGFFPKFLTINWLSPEARHLLALAAGWDQLTVEVTSELEPEPILVAPLSGILMLYALYEELCAVSHSVLMHAKLLKTSWILENLETIHSLGEDIENATGKIEITWMSKNSRQVISSPYRIKTLNEIAHIVRLFYDDASVHFSETNFAQSVNTFTLLTLFEVYRPKIVFKREDISNPFSLQIESDKTVEVLSNPEMWSLIHLPSQLEDEIISLLNNSMISSEWAASHWLNTARTMNKLRRMSPATRCSAELENYQPIEKQGYLLLKTFLPKLRQRDFAFSEPEVYTSGKLTKGYDNFRNIRVDSITTKNQRNICAVLSIPKYFSSINSTPNRFTLVFHEFLRQYYRRLEWTLPIFFAALATAGILIDELYDISGMSLFLRIIIVLVGSPILRIAPNMILRTLDLVVKPEHTRDI